MTDKKSPDAKQGGGAMPVPSVTPVQAIKGLGGRYARDPVTKELVRIEHTKQCAGCAGKGGGNG